MIDYEEKRSETRHRMGFMTPLLVFVLAFFRALRQGGAAVYTKHK